MKKPLTILINHHDDTNIRPFSRKAEETLQVFPPLGIAYLASHLRANGRPVEIIDANALGIGPEELGARLASSGAGVVGITSTTIGWHGAVDAARVARAALPNALIVAGGPHLSVFPAESMLLGAFDVGVIGDGEETILEIVKKVENGEPVVGIPGTVVMADGQAKIAPPRPWIADISQLPHPAVDLLPLEKYRCLTVEAPFFTMISSRGCPFRCGFCSQVYCGDTVRFRSPEDVAGEMEKYVRDYGAKEIVMFDETFTLNEKRVLEICRLIGEKKLRFRWNVRTRVDTITRPMLGALKKAGCYGLHMGVESGSERILEVMKKGITLEQIRNAFGLAREYGFLTRGYFMIGYLEEDRESYRQTVKLAIDLGLDWASFSITTPLPDTELFREASRRELIDPDFWKKYTLLENPPGKFPVIASDNWSQEDLRGMMADAYRRFYLRPSYALRRLCGVRSWKHLSDMFRGVGIIGMMEKQPEEGKRKT